MRRLETFAIVLAFILTLSACGGEESPSGDPILANTGGDNGILYECSGLQVVLSTQYWDLLYVETDFPDAGSSWTPLISVYEKASYEAAMEEYGGGGGFLFGLLAMDQAAFEQHISADGSGIDIFATDGERYYAYTYPTDVQFCRPGGEIDTESDDWKTWEELNEIGPVVREDFLTRNSLQSFTVQDFTDQLAADDGNHVCLRYYDYFLADGDTWIYDTLLLHQPARQGEGGIWAVDQWMDVYGSQYLYFPDSGMPAAEYYAQLQEECDAGAHPEYLTPAGAAAVFVKDYFGHETSEGSFEEVREVDYGYMERNQRLQQLALNLMFERDVDDMNLLECVGEATAANWGVLGRYQYGSDWFNPMMSAVADAAVGENQQARDKAVMTFLLTTWDAQADFYTPLSGVLQAQRLADENAFQAAAAEFLESVRPILFAASLPVESAPMSSDLPEAAEEIAVDVPTY